MKSDQRSDEIAANGGGYCVPAGRIIFVRAAICSAHIYFFSSYRLRNFFQLLIYPSAFSFVSASAAMRSSGSVPEKRHMTQLPSVK